jgi:hypothetical protein
MGTTVTLVRSERCWARVWGTATASVSITDWSKIIAASKAVTVRRAGSSAHDRPLNAVVPATSCATSSAIDLGQVEGGFVQGMGWLTTGELWWDDKDHLRTHALSTYKIPACGAVPAAFNVSLFKADRNKEDVAYRSKAAGEPPLMLGIAAMHAFRLPAIAL